MPVFMNSNCARGTQMTEFTTIMKSSEAGLSLPDDMPFEDWSRLGDEIAGMAKNIQWFWGDWLNYGEKRYGEKYTEAVEKYGLNRNTAQQYAWVAREFETCARAQLPWAHHRVVAGIADEAERTELLTQAKDQGWSVARLRQEIKASPVLESAKNPTEPEDALKLIGELRTACVTFSNRFGKERFEIMAAVLREEADSLMEIFNGST